MLQRERNDNNMIIMILYIIIYNLLFVILSMSLMILFISSALMESTQLLALSTLPNSIRDILLVMRYEVLGTVAVNSYSGSLDLTSVTTCCNASLEH